MLRLNYSNQEQLSNNNLFDLLNTESVNPEIKNLFKKKVFTKTENTIDKIGVQIKNSSTVDEVKAIQSIEVNNLFLGEYNPNLKLNSFISNQMSSDQTYKETLYKNVQQALEKAQPLQIANINHKVCSICLSGLSLSQLGVSDWINLIDPISNFTWLNEPVFLNTLHIGLKNYFFRQILISNIAHCVYFVHPLYPDQQRLINSTINHLIKYSNENDVILSNFNKIIFDHLDSIPSGEVGYGCLK